MQLSRNLIAFAFIKERFDESGDIIDGLMPLFAPVIGARHGQKFNPRQFSDDVDKFYGLKMHPYVVEYLAPRMESAGLLARETRVSNYVEYTNLGDAASKISTTENNIGILLDEMHEFISLKIKKAGFLIEAEEIERSIYERILKFDPSLSSYDILPSPSVTTTLTLSRKIENRPDNYISPVDEALDIAFASFVLFLQNNRPLDFGRLTDISTGALISEVILSFRTPPKIGSDISSSFLFLDGPLLLDLFDLTSPEQYQFIDSLVSSLQQMGLKIAAFEHSVIEAENIINITLKNHGEKKSTTGDTGRRIVYDPFALTRLQMIRPIFRAEISKKGILIIDPEADSAYWHYKKYLKKEDEDALLSSIRPSSDLPARIVDTKSGSWVIRLVRSRPQVANIFGLPALFVSKNTTLIYTLTSFGRRSKLINADAASPFISDRYAAALAWIANGGAGYEIPTRRLIARCVAAVAPRKDVVTKMRDVLRNLEPERAEQFEVLMRDRRCAHLLMDETLGNASIITQESAHSLLEKMRMETAIDVAQQKDQFYGEELEKNKKELKLKDEKHAEEIAEKKSLISTLDDERAQLKVALESSNFAIKNQQSALLSECLRSADISGFCLMIGVALLISIIIACGGLFFPNSPWAIYGTPIIVLIFTVVSFAAAPEFIFGNTIKRYKMWRFSKIKSKRCIDNLLFHYEITWSFSWSNIEITDKK